MLLLICREHNGRRPVSDHFPDVVGWTYIRFFSFCRSWLDSLTHSGAVWHRSSTSKQINWIKENAHREQPPNLVIRTTSSSCYIWNGMQTNSVLNVFRYIACDLRRGLMFYRNFSHFPADGQAKNNLLLIPKPVWEVHALLRSLSAVMRNDCLEALCSRLTLYDCIPILWDRQCMWRLCSRLWGVAYNSPLLVGWWTIANELWLWCFLHFADV